MDADGMPLRAFITRGPQADCKQASKLIEGFKAKYLLADRGYDNTELIKQAKGQGMSVLIAGRKNRREKRVYDKGKYELRHRIENTILQLKRWRGIATRYARNASSFLAAVHIRCLALWLKVS